jgi:chemotaxis protein MotB
MSRSNHEPTEPRIIRKKKAGRGHHGGAWKVAYADFVTAMMALFIVLWIMGQSQSIRLAVAQYFKNPGLLPASVSLMEASDMGGEMPTPGHSQELQRQAPISPEISQDRSSLEEVKKRLEEMIAQLPELQNLKDQVHIEITGEGLRIELLEQEDSLFFDIGSANLKAETKKILALIAQELGRLPNHMTIEGHTDSRPYGGQGSYTNWELSTDRANAARRLMETTGLKPHSVFAVRGFADRQLRNPQDPLDFQNRRVSIIVMFQNLDPSITLEASRLEAVQSLAAKPAGPPPAGQGNEGNAAAPPENLVSDDVQHLLKPLNPQIKLGW